MICPKCGGSDIAELDGLWSCGSCGYQGGGLEFDPNIRPELYSLWLEELMGKDWVEEHFPEEALPEAQEAGNLPGVRDIRSNCHNNIEKHPGRHFRASLRE